MALGHCRECGREVSTEAAACPSCGAPNPTGSALRPREKSNLAAGCLGLLLGPVGLWYKGRWAAGFAWLVMTLILGSVTLGIAVPFCWLGMAVHAVAAEANLDLGDAGRPPRRVRASARGRDPAGWVVAVIMVGFMAARRAWRLLGFDQREDKREDSSISPGPPTRTYERSRGQPARLWLHAPSVPCTVSPLVNWRTTALPVIGSPDGNGWAAVYARRTSPDTVGFVYAQLLQPVPPERAVATPSETTSERLALTGCDMDLAANIPEMALQALPTINLWETIENGRVVGQARGLDTSQPRGTPAWCVGEVVTVLSRGTDSNGRRRVRVRTQSGLVGWVTDFFVLQ